jgi:hypothetical protein
LAGGGQAANRSGMGGRENGSGMTFVGPKKRGGQRAELSTWVDSAGGVLGGRGQSFGGRKGAGGGGKRKGGRREYQNRSDAEVWRKSTLKMHLAGHGLGHPLCHPSTQRNKQHHHQRAEMPEADSH